MEHLFTIIALVILILRFATKKEKPKELFEEDLAPEPPEIPVHRYVPKEVAAPVIEQKISLREPPRVSRSSSLRQLLRKDGRNSVLLSEILKKKF